MADKTFHSMKFPGLPDTYKIPDIVNEYSPSSAYAVGDYVLKDGKTYKCTTAIASGETWTTAHWTEVKVGNDLQGEVADLKSAVSEIITIDVEIDSSTFVNLSGYYIGGAAPHIIGQANGCSMMYVVCSPNTQYVIQKIESNRFNIGYTTVTPASSVEVYGYSSNSGTSAYYTTGNNAAFLCVYYKHDTDTISESTIFNSIKIYEQTLDVNAVLVNKAQNFTEVQKKQARDNIGIGNLELYASEIPDTIQSYVFSAGSVSQVVHSRNNVTVRTDTFTYSPSSITEVRTLNTGESLTIVTNLTTLETTVTYSAA